MEPVRKLALGREEASKSALPLRDPKIGLSKHFNDYYKHDQRARGGGGRGDLDGKDLASHASMRA